MINSGTASFAVHLEYGSAYTFAARCGSECRHLHLVLKDASRQVVENVDHLNDTPHFIYRPHSTGVYVLSLELAGCSAGRCQVGAVVLAQPEHQGTWRDVFAGSSSRYAAAKVQVARTDGDQDQTEARHESRGEHLSDYVREDHLNEAEADQPSRSGHLSTA
jgi:hypothetical protein